MLITTNLDSKPYQPPFIEYLNKFDVSAKKKMFADYIEASKSYVSSTKELSQELASGNISMKQFQDKKKKIEDNISKSFHRSPIPQVIEGKNGAIEIKHKNKLGFIFIGDTTAEDDEDVVVNSPKMCFAVGGSLETTYNPFTNEEVKIDPRQNFIKQASAQIHLLSRTNIDTKGVLAIDNLNGRSSIKTEADILELYSKEAVVIRSFGRPYLSSGAISYVPGGVHIVSGKNTLFSEIKPTEPMVLGQQLAEYLWEFSDIINEIVSAIISMSRNMVLYKEMLQSHKHFVPLEFGVTTSTSSPEIILYNKATVPTKDFIDSSNLYSLLNNILIAKLKNLTAFSPNKFLSDFNRVN